MTHTTSPNAGSDCGGNEIPRLLKGVCWALISLGILLSLTGPCRYWIDQDLDLDRTARLLHGELSILLRGPHAQVFRQTPTGIFYAVLAPAMAVSGRPEWIYTYVDALILLGCIPIWYLGRFFCGRKVAWVATALYAISSGRILYGQAWIFVALPLVILWNLLLVKYLLSRRPILAAACVVLLPVLISLHLSYLTLPPVMVLLIIACRLIPKVPLLTRRMVLWGITVIGFLGVLGAIGLWMRYGSIGFLRLIMRIANAFAAAGEHYGFFVDRHLLGYDFFAKSPLVYLPLIILIVGFHTIWARQAGPSLTENKTRMDRLVLLRLWSTCTLAVVIPSAIVMVPEWSFPSSYLRYRYFTPLAPVFVIILAIGLLRTARWLTALSRRRLSRRLSEVVVLLLVAAGYVAAVLYSNEQRPWRVAGPAVHPQLQEPLARCLERWNPSREWMEGAAFLEPAQKPRFDSDQILPMQQHFSYLFHWLIDQHTQVPPRGFPEDEVLYLVAPGSAAEQEVLSAGVALDSVDTGVLRGYLCQRTARVMLPFEPYVSLKIPEPGAGCQTAEHVAQNVSVGDRTFVLIASNIQPPPDLRAEMLFEVIIEKEGEDLVVGCRLYGWIVLQWEFGPKPADNDVLQGPHVLIRSSHGRTVRIDIHYDRFLKSRNRRDLSTICTLKGWAPEDIEDVLCGVDSYLDPSHYSVPKTETWSIMKRRS